MVSAAVIDGALPLGSAPRLSFDSHWVPRALFSPAHNSPKWGPVYVHSAPN